jgi:hypothetical protein
MPAAVILPSIQRIATSDRRLQQSLASSTTTPWRSDEMLKLRMHLSAT